MKVFVAGGTGAMGKRLVPQLVAGGYEVVAMTRSEDKARGLRELGVAGALAVPVDLSGMVAAVTGASRRAGRGETHNTNRGKGL